MGHDVFISHSATDKEIANRIASKLEGGEVPCWVAPRDIRPGDTWGGSILKAIQSSKLMVIIFSSKSNESQQVMREVELAVQNNVVVLPFRVEDVQPSNDMKYFLSATHWLDALSTDLDTHLDHLFESARSILGKSVSVDTDPGNLDEEVASVTSEPSNDLPDADVPHEAKENKVKVNTTKLAKRSEPRLEPSMGEPVVVEPAVVEALEADETVGVDTHTEGLEVSGSHEKTVAHIDDQSQLLQDDSSDLSLENESVVVDVSKVAESQPAESKPTTTELLREEGENRSRGNATAAKSNAPAMAIGLLFLAAVSVGAWYYFSNDQAQDNSSTASLEKSDGAEAVVTDGTDLASTEVQKEVDIPGNAKPKILTKKAKKINADSTDPYQDAPVVIKQRNTPSKDQEINTVASSDKQNESVVGEKEVGLVAQISTQKSTEQELSKGLAAEVMATKTSEVQTKIEPNVIDNASVEKSSDGLKETLNGENNTTEPLFDSSDLAKELQRESESLASGDDSIEIVEGSVQVDDVPLQNGSEVIEEPEIIAQDTTVSPSKPATVDVSNKRTLDEIKLAAEQGEALAQQQLGFRYENGQGVSQSDREAVRLYKLSANQGNADAQHSLGIMYELGVGVSQNEAEAENWYKQAAAQGNLEAQRYLSEMLERQGR